MKITSPKTKADHEEEDYFRVLFPSGDELAVVINEHLDERNLDFSQANAEIFS